MIPPRNAGQYRASLGRPHHAYSRIEVWRSGVQVEELLPLDRTADRYTVASAPVFFDGSVRSTLQSRVTRTLNISVPDWLYPFKVTDLLNPYGTQLKAFRGIQYGDGSVEEFPVFTGPVTGARPSGGGRADIRANDITALVTRNGFAVPQFAVLGSLVTDEYKRVVLDGYPQATFGPFDDLWELVPALTYDDDRGQALDTLTKTASAFWYALADGRFVLRRIAWTVAGTPVTRMADGEDGVLVSAFPERTSDNVINQWTVSGERIDGAAPVYATVADIDPLSVTRTTGPYGVVSAQVLVSGAITQGQAYDLAQTLVRRSRALTESWRVTCVPDASLELGDTFDLSYLGREATQVIAGFTMPLLGGAMDIDGRALVPASQEPLT